MKANLEYIKSQIIPVLKKAGVVRSSIFGSYARGEETKDSDVDILIEFSRGKSLLDLVGLEQDLEQILDKKVDVVTYKSVNPRLKKYIDEDQIQIL